MKNITKFKKAATENGFKFYYDRNLRLYALYRTDGIQHQTDYFTKTLINNINDIDILIKIHIKS